MKRLSLAILFGASAACFAKTLATPPAWALFALAAVSLVWTRSGVDPSRAASLRTTLFVGLGATVLYGWVLMVYPVLSASAIRWLSLSLGYMLGGLGGFFLLHDTEIPEWSTSVPGAVGMLVVASFDLEAPIHGYLVVAGVAGFGVLASALIPSSDERRLARIVSLALILALSAGVATSIVMILPLAQTQVERTMVSIYTPMSDGAQARHQARLGELQSLKLSSEIVMRVWSERPQRLRTRVMVRFDKTLWHRDPSTVETITPVTRTNVEAGSRAFLQSLPGSDFAVAPATNDPGRLIQTRVVRVDGGEIATPGGSLVVNAPVDELQLDTAGAVMPPPQTRVRLYGVLHELNHQRAQRGPASAVALEASLQVPDGLDPRFQTLADELARGVVDDEAKARRVVDHLRESYEYSLDVGNVDQRDPLAYFLFDKRAGWCEYFAGSAAVLLRLQGVPTRYVEGFNVIGSQRKGEYYLVREWDRHAWIEAYIAGKGWLEYDPTPAAEFDSLHAGLDDHVFSAALEWLRVHMATLYVELTYFDASRAVMPLISLGVLIVLIWVLRRVVRLFRVGSPRAEREERAAPSVLTALVRELDTKLDELGWSRPLHRAPLEHWSSLPSDALPPPLRSAGASVIAAYYRHRYGGEAIDEGDVTRGREALAQSVKRSSD